MPIYGIYGNGVLIYFIYVNKAKFTNLGKWNSRSIFLNTLLCYFEVSKMKFSVFLYFLTFSKPVCSEEPDCSISRFLFIILCLFFIPDSHFCLHLANVFSDRWNWNSFSLITYTAKNLCEINVVWILHFLLYLSDKKRWQLNSFD